mgnify:CR=1 FL=1
MNGDSLRDDRDAIQAKIDALCDKLNTAELTMTADDFDALADAISDEIGRLEAELDEADAAIAREDPERGVWGRDGL